MKGQVVRITASRSCEVRLANEILVVFPEPAGHTFALDDVISFLDFRLDSDVQIVNHSSGERFTVQIRANNVHDLRLPWQHGISRTPSLSRLASKWFFGFDG